MKTAEHLETLDDDERAGRDLDTIDLPDVRRRVSPLRVAARAVSIVAILTLSFLGYEFGATKLVASRWQREALRDLKDQMETGTMAVPGFVPQPATSVAILSIPILGMKDVVLEGTTPNILKAGPGHVRGTPLPGQVGNVVIAGRRLTYGSPFSRITELQVGDEIELTTGQGVFAYLVTGTWVVRPGDPDVLASSQQNQITLMTSSPALTANGRFVVRAELQGPAYAAVARPYVPLEAKESGLVGDPDGTLPAAAWGVAFAASAALAWRLRRRGTDARVLYLLASPILLTTAFLAFENVDRLLAGTL